MFVVVNCTHMQTDIRVDLFMNSRDRMRSGANSEALETEIEHFLGEEPILQKLNRKRQEDRIKRSLEDQKPLEDTLRNLVKNNPRLAELLPFGLRIPTSNIGLGTGPDENSAFEGKKHPTFFRFRKNRNLIERLQPINQAVRLIFETDVIDNYFSRKLTPGSLSLKCLNQNNEELLVDYRVGNLNAGLMSIVLKLDPKKVLVGEILEFNFIVSDDSLVEPFRNKLKLTVLDPAITNPPVLMVKIRLATSLRGLQAELSQLDFQTYRPWLKMNGEKIGLNCLQYKLNRIQMLDTIFITIRTTEIFSTHNHLVNQTQKF